MSFFSIKRVKPFYENYKQLFTPTFDFELF